MICEMRFHMSTQDAIALANGTNEVAGVVVRDTATKQVDKWLPPVEGQVQKVGPRALEAAGALAKAHPAACVVTAAALVAGLGCVAVSKLVSDRRERAFLEAMDAYVRSMRNGTVGPSEVNALSEALESLPSKRWAWAGDPSFKVVCEEMHSATNRDLRGHGLPERLVETDAPALVVLREGVEGQMLLLRALA